MVYLLAAIAASTLFALGLKVSENRGYNRVGVAFANYATGAFLAFLWWVGPWCAGRGEMAGETLGYGVLGGAAWVGGLITLMVSTRENGVALTAGISRLALLVTIACCILFWGESLGWIEGVGVLLALAAILLMGVPASRREGRTSGWGILLLLLVLFTQGAAQIILKVFEGSGGERELTAFFLVMFATGALLTGLVLPLYGRPLRRRELGFGALLGLPNLYSGAFLVLALQEMRGTIAFPAVNAGTLFLLVLAGLLFWRERAGRAGVAGLALTVLALVLIKGAELIRELLEVVP